MEYKYEPKTKTALIAAIREEIKLQGNRANLNCINTSAITNMRELFNKFKSFDGDISEWDVSNVTDMTDMFKESHFRGDISKWNVDKVEYFIPMFSYSHIPDDHKPERFRYNRPADAPLLEGRISWMDVSFTLTGDGVCTVSGDLSEDASFGEYLGLDCRDLPVKHLVIAEGVKEIGNYTFYGWSKIEELTLPSSLIRIGRMAFGRCWNISRINFSDGLQIIESFAFSSCPVSVLNLPKTLTTIGASAFEGFGQLAELDLPDSIVSIGNRAFSGCSLLRSVKMPAHLKHIPESVFSQCPALEHVQMPEDLEEIDKYAFDDLEFEEGGLHYTVTNYVTNINECSVGAKEWEGDLDIPSSVCHDGRTFIVNEIDFSKCRKLTRASIPDTVSVIPYLAFYGCSALSDVEIPSSVTSIGAQAFNGCAALKAIEIPSSVTFIGNAAFAGCTSLRSIKMPSSVNTIESEAFAGCTSLRSIELPDSVTEIPDNLFDGCWKLRSVRLGANTTTIGEYAFMNCEFLQQLHLPDSVQYIGSYAFEKCKNLMDLNMPTSLKCLGLYALEGTPIMEQEGPIYVGNVLCGFGGRIPKHACLEVREGTTLVAEAAFRERENLESVILPDSLEIIGYEAFNDCPKLKHVHLPKSLNYLGSGAFDWTPISEVEVPWETPIEDSYRPFPENAVVYVPVGAGEAYKASKEWKKYKIVEKENCACDTSSFINEETVIVGRKETYRVVLIEKPQRKSSWTLYGVIVPSKPDVDGSKAVRDLLYECFRDTALFLDWEEDRDFGHCQPLREILEYNTHRFAVVDLPEDASPETVKLNGKTYLTDEAFYKSLTDSGDIEWKPLEESK